MRMSKGVKVDPRQTKRLACRSPAPANCVRCKRRAISLAENQGIGCRLPEAESQPRLESLAPVRPQVGHGGRWQGDCSSPVDRLGLLELQSGGRLLQAPLNVHDSGV